jgi:hypothetical protein
MTTNIKLFENWIAEEEAAATPVAPVAATTPTAAPTAATAPTGTPTGTPATAPKMKEYMSFTAVRIGDNPATMKDVNITIKILAPEPFDINKSKLEIVSGFTPGPVKYVYTPKDGAFTFDKTDSLNDDNYTKLKEGLGTSNIDKSKHSFQGIINDVQKQINPSFQVKDSASNSNYKISDLVKVARVNSYRGSLAYTNGVGGTLTVNKIDERLTKIAMSTEVNIDTLIPTGKYNVYIEFMYQGSLKREGQNQSVADPIKRAIELVKQNLGADLSTSLQPVLTKQLADSQARAAVKIV